MKFRVLVVLLLLALAGCGSRGEVDAGDAPFTLPVGPSTWDTGAPAWYHDGTLHVGTRSVELGRGVEKFVLGATGAYWMRGSILMFTSAEGRTREVHEVGWGNIAVSADHTVFATVDQSRGPTDRYGAHVMQVAVFDTRTGKQLYRTPDRKPDRGDDLGALYPEVMPLLEGVSNTRLFYAGNTIDLADGTTTKAGQDPEGVDKYAGYAETLFPEGYHVGVRGEGKHRQIVESTLYGTALLSPDRSTVFDVTQWPTDAVVYDARTGNQRSIGAPWDHFSLGGWSDAHTFFGVAEKVDQNHPVDVVRARQVVSCDVRTLACTPAGPVLPTEGNPGETPSFLLEGSAQLL